MNRKFILAVIVSSVVAFLGGWLIFGITFSDYYASHSSEVAKRLMKRPVKVWAVGIGNISWSLLLTYILQKNESNTFLKGLMTSLWVSFLILLIFNFSIYAFWDIYTLDFLISDIFISSLYWGLVGGIAGAILGAEKKTVVVDA
jgi:hypothetical protein